MTRWLWQENATRPTPKVEYQVVRASHYPRWIWQRFDWKYRVWEFTEGSYPVSYASAKGAKAAARREWIREHG